MFTFLGKLAAGFCIVAGIAHYVYVIALATDLGLQAGSPELKQFMTATDDSKVLIAFGLILGVLCEISKSLGNIAKSYKGALKAEAEREEV